MENRSQETFSAFTRNLASQCNTSFGKFAERVARLEHAHNATVAELNHFKAQYTTFEAYANRNFQQFEENSYGTVKHFSEIEEKIAELQLWCSESDEMAVDEGEVSHDSPSPPELPSIIRKCPRPLFLLASQGVSDKAGPRHGSLPIATGRG